uniref:Uncharacterized protein LOC114325934 n=1 Tax=Diabrotica virgifera virgifera TaxID=50390 RepID=A0A6P7F8V0_DIAVI
MVMVKYIKCHKIKRKRSVIKMNQNQMEVNHQISEETFKIEIKYNHLNDALLDEFKCEIQEESNWESTHDKHGSLDLQKFPIKTEIDQHGNNLNRFKENQKTEKDYLQENKMEIIDTVTEYSSNEENYMNPHAEGQSLNKNIKVVTGEKPHKCEFCFKQFSLATIT